MPPQERLSRKEQILRALAEMLEQQPGARITTAGLARQVGVSEAALYRHFASKAQIFEELIEFIEKHIFPNITIILREEESTAVRCGQIIELLLTFAERNPGITRILTGDPLSGESERLRNHIIQFFERIETQLKQVLRESPLRDDIQLRLDIQSTANLMLAFVEGKISQYVRSDFKRLPTDHWNEQWYVLQESLFQAQLPDQG